MEDSAPTASMDAAASSVFVLIVVMCITVCALTISDNRVGVNSFVKKIWTFFELCRTKERKNAGQRSAWGPKGRAWPGGYVISNVLWCNKLRDSMSYVALIVEMPTGDNAGDRTGDKWLQDGPRSISDR